LSEILFGIGNILFVIGDIILVSGDNLSVIGDNLFGISKILVVIENYFPVRVILFFVIDDGTFITDVLTLILAD